LFAETRTWEVRGEGPAPAKRQASRVYDYLLGGKGHFAADREIMELVPPGLVEARRWHPGWPELPKKPPATARPSLA
jgi:hypothetical protein